MKIIIELSVGCHDLSEAEKKQLRACFNYELCDYDDGRYSFASELIQDGVARIACKILGRDYVHVLPWSESTEGEEERNGPL